ncbi:MAG: SDR family oxidoreductase [Alphaproteobacteria bacterium]|nr:SDR family oxidoreductase [Alphaproteobacteria bacterium]
MEIALKGKRTLITAGASGIGRVIADVFAENGARIHLCDIDEAALAKVRAERPEFGASVADVADPAAVDRLFDEALPRLGGLDILINNAGIAGPTKPFAEVTPEEFTRTMAVNLNSQFFCTRRAVAPLRAAGGGAIVNLSSVAGRFPMPLRTPYSTSKFAVCGFTSEAAYELGPDNIRVNAILPGAVEGPRLRNVLEKQAAAAGRTYDEWLPTVLSMISMRTMVSQRDIAEMALFLSSDAGRHVSGQLIAVCGNFEGYRRPGSP